MVINRYKLLPGGTDILLPESAEILSVEAIEDKVYLWAKVSQENVLSKRMALRGVEVRATGQNFILAKGERFIGTVVMYEGSLVWHVFEIPYL